MASFLDSYQLAPEAGPAPPPAAPPEPKSFLDAYELAPEQPGQPRAAAGFAESVQAGFQGSAAGLAWRGKLPDLVMDPKLSKWWERAAAGITQVGAELPLMAVGGAVGAPVGAGIGGAITGPAAPAGAIVGGILGTGAGMFAVPAAIRESLIQAYKSGDVKTASDWWNIVREVATTTAKEGAIGAATFGAGAVAARTVGKAIAPMIGESMTVGTGVKAIGAADVAGQIATMVTMPAALQGRLPDAQEFLDAAIVIGGLKLAHPIAARITNVFVKTGKTPAEQAADAQRDLNIADDLKKPATERPEREVDPLRGQLSKQEELFSIQGQLGELDRRAPESLTPEERSTQEDLRAQEEALKPQAQAEKDSILRLVTERKQALDEKGSGTADQTITDQDGNKQVIPGKQPEFMTDDEKSEQKWLKENINDPEAVLKRYKLVRTEEPAPPTPRGTLAPAPYTDVQLADATKRAQTRLDELKTKADTEPLTDAERAERISLTNAMANPEALAKRFGIEPAVRPPTQAEHDASAQRIYDQFYAEAIAADDARRAAGREPLGEDHARGVALIVQHRAEAIARATNTLPEHYLGMRQPHWVEEAAARIAAAEAAVPPGAPRFVPPELKTPELDLFGDPVVDPVELLTTPRHAAGGDIPIVKLKIADLTLSKDVPQFKGGADAQGVVDPLSGEVDTTGVGPIQVWERLNGALEVISGRHRFAHWKARGVPEIAAQIHREADGFTRDQAASLDAILNIRDGQGSIADYATYFKTSRITKEAADAAGLLGRIKGRTGFAIARDASPDVLAAHRAGLLSDDAALAISNTAPGSERLQALGVNMINEGKSILMATNTMRAVDLMAAERMAAGAQGDIFGFDDSAMREAVAMGKKAASMQRKISDQISAVQGAARRPEIARTMGVDVADPEGIQKKILELRQQQYQWDNWPLYPELVAKLRRQELRQEAEPFELKAETPAELKARNDEAADAAKRKLEQDQNVSETIVSGHGEDLITLYHGTSKEGALAIRQSGVIKKGSYFGNINGVSLTPNRRAAEEFGSEVIEVKIPKNRLIVDPESRDDADIDSALRDGASVYAAGDVLLQKQDTQGTLFQTREDRPWYYSELARQIGASPMKQGDAKAWTDYIKSRVGKGVKNEEIEATGIMEWLATREGKVTRDEVNAFMEQGGVRVTETVLGGKLEATPQDREIAVDTGLLEAKGFVIEQNQAVPGQWGVMDPAGEIYTSPGDARQFEEEIGASTVRSIDSVLEHLNSTPEERKRRFVSDYVSNKQHAHDVWADHQVDIVIERHGGIETPYHVQEVKVGRATRYTVFNGPTEEMETFRIEEDAYNKADSLNEHYREEVERDIRNDLPSFDEDQSVREAELDWEHEYGDANEGMQTKFSQYQEPGAVPGSYRELVLTLPDIKRVSFDQFWRNRPLISEAIARREYERYLIDPTVSGDSSERGLFFTSTHFPDAGDYIAHTRVNDRMVPVESIAATMPELAARLKAEGKTEAKALFVEEFQNDRQAAARKIRNQIIEQKMKDLGISKEEAGKLVPADIGFAGSGRSAKLNDEKTKQYGFDMYTVFNKDGLPLDNIRGTSPEEAVTKFNEQSAISKVPSAPFVIKTDAWTALVLKRLLSYAASGGYDAISWTTGEQQVTRYTDALRKAVDVIEWKKTAEGVQLVGYKGIARQPGETAVRQKVVDTTEKESVLSDAIGKSMADKIRNDPNQEGTIEGEGITVSSTGMAESYDRIIPKVAREVLKGLGGGKIQEIGLVTKDQRANMTIAHDGTNYWVKDSRTGERLSENAPDYMAAAKLEDAMRAGETKQMAIEITPKMREKIMAGQPLFQTSAQERDDTHLGSYNVAERLITTLAGANKSTVIHELGHHFLEDLKYYASRPGATDKIKADWETARREFAIGEEGDISTASHEMMARTWERYLAKGEAPSEGLRGVFEQFKRWMLDIYKDIRTLGVPINQEIRRLFDNMLATEDEATAAKDMDIPRAYVAEARAATAEKIVPSPEKGGKADPGFKDEQLAIEPFAEELLPGPGSGLTNDSRVNAQYINGPMDLKLAIQQIANRDQANIQQHRGGAGGVRSWEQANAEADKLAEEVMGGKMADSALDRSPNAPPHDIQQRAAFKIMMAIAKYSLKLRDEILDKGDNASVQDQFDYLNSILRMRMAHAEFLGLRAAAARAMNQIRDMTPESGAIDKMVELTSGRDQTLYQDARTPAEQAADIKAKLDEIMRVHFSGKGALDIARLQKDVKSLKGQLALAKEVTEASTWEMVVEGWKMGMLSGPQTPVVNVVGTWSFQALRAPIDAVAATIGMARGASPGMGETDRASMSEALARITGPLRGIQAGLKLAYHSFEQGELTGKTESYRPAIPGRAAELYRKLTFGVMSAGDVLTTTTYKRGELETLAIRTAFDEDLNPGTREFADRVQHLIDNPTPSIEAEANRASARMAFNDPGGEKMRSMQNFVRQWNLQWIAPFIRTPGNVAEEMIRLTPFAPALGSWRADIAKGGVARDKAIAEVLVGSGIMALTMAYAFNGQITGSGDPDPGKNRGKAGVWQANSILVGDRYYEIGRLQPGGTLMVLAADVANAWDHMTEEEKDKVPKILAMAFANAITNQTMLQGLTNIVHLMSEPDRYGGRFFQSLAGSMVPNIVGQTVTMSDPYVREVNSMMEAIQSRTPWRQELMAKRDWLGEPVQTSERMGVVLPVKEQQVSEDKVRLEAARLDISMAAAPKKTHIGKGTGKLGQVELTPEERNKFAEIGGKFAHGILAGIVSDPGYDQIPDLIKRKIFAKVLATSHAVAAVGAMPMEKRIEYLQQITEDIAAELTPEAAPQ